MNAPLDMGPLDMLPSLDFAFAPVSPVLSVGGKRRAQADAGVWDTAMGLSLIHI